MDSKRKPIKKNRGRKPRNSDQLVDAVPLDSGVVENPQQENQSLKEKEDSMVQLMPAWTVKHLTNEGNNTMAARSEPEKQNSSEQDDQFSEATSSRAELPVDEMAWQTKYEALQEKFREEMAQTEPSWETKVQQLEERNTELLEKKQSCEAKLEKLERELAEQQQSWETRLKQVEEEKKELEMMKKEAGSFIGFWRWFNKRYEALQEKFREEMAQTEQNWETKVQQLEERNTELAENEQSLERKLKESQEEKNRLVKKEQNWETQVKQLQEENTELLQKEESCEAKLGKLERELAEQQQSWETRMKQVEEEKKELEDLCRELKMEKKKKKCRFFGFRRWFKTEQAEFPLDEKACQAKCESLQEKFREEMAENQQSLEEKKELEDHCLELKKKKKKKSFFQKWFKTGRSNVET